MTSTATGRRSRRLSAVSLASANVAAVEIENRSPRIGDVVYLTKSLAPELLIVVDNPDAIHVVDLSLNEEVRKFGNAYVAVVSDSALRFEGK